MSRLRPSQGGADMTQPLRLTMILGSVGPNRLCDRVADWPGPSIAAGPDFQLDRVDARDDWPELNAAGVRQIAAAAAFLVVTPEYSRSFAAPLKALIDAGGAEWRAKPVAFVG